MREIGDRGIIWQVKSYREKDLLITLLSATEGKLHLLAKGARGSNGKRKGILQPFCCVNFAHTIPANPHGLPVLTRTEFLFSTLSQEPVILAELTLLIEISNRFLETQHHVPGIFMLWEEFLKIDFQKPREELCGFLVQFFTKLGLFPRFQSCNSCEQKFSAEKEIFWQDGSGIFCCGRSPDTSVDSSKKRLSFAQLKSLFFFQTCSPAQFVKLQLTSIESTELLAVIFQEIASFSKQPFRAKNIFEILLK